MRKKILDVLKWVWFVAVLIGAAYYFKRNYQEISGYLKTISLGRVGLSVLFLFLGKFTLSDLTRISLKKVDHDIDYKDALTITSVTQLGKYLPGGIWHVAGKFGIYKARKLSTKKTTEAIIFENVWLLSSALVIGVTFLLFSNQDVLCEFQSIFCKTETNQIILILLPLLWLAGLLIFDRLFFKEKRYRFSELVILLLEMLLIWVSFGISCWLIFPIHDGYITAIIGAFSLSWVAGYVAFFAPGGIGIREYLLTLLLSSFFSSGEVAIYATIHRLLWVLIEVILGASCTLIFGIPMTEGDEESNK